MKRWLRYLVSFSIIASLCISLLPLGCGGPVEGSIEWLTRMNDSSTKPDSDGDGLKDDVEEYVGTDPNSRDSDRDGLTDKYEIFNLADENGARSLVDQDENGVHAALDNDDNGDGTDDGDVDSDGDGISNKLEYYGYTYDVISGEYGAWYIEDDRGNIKDGPYYDDQDNAIAYYKTDPTQFSTDQDPYSDGMEASGLNMDKSVVTPGDSPMVPAYPDIYVSMTSYEVTPKGTITSSSGGQTQDSWSNSATSEMTAELHWDVSASQSVEVSTSGAGVKASVTESMGGMLGSRHSSTSSTSGFDSSNWNDATTTDPSKAAELILSLKFENLGTATAQNIIPTISLMLGDKGITTYKLPDDKKIDVLGANAIFPESGYWVIGDDTTDEIVVTMDELRSIQLGAPLLLTVPQVSADVMQQDEQGHWQAVDNWENFKPRIDGVCARLSVDIGGGQMKDYRVYATDPKNTGPTVTLKDIAFWTVGLEQTEDGSISIMGKSLTNCRFGFSDANLQDVKEQLTQMGEDANLLDVVVKPGWDITLKAAPATNEPEIIWTSYDPSTRRAAAYVEDYYQVKQVVFKAATKDYPMTDSEGAGIYTVDLPAGYTFIGSETIKATNDRKYSATKLVTGMYAAPSWSMYCHDAQRTGRSQYNGPDSATQKWGYRTGGPILASSSAIGNDGTIYIGSDNHYLYAISPNGNLKWKFQTGSLVDSSPAIGADSTIYVGSDDGYLYAFNPDGSLKWKFETKYNEGGAIRSSPVIGADGTIYFGCYNGALYAVEDKGGEGKEKWRYDTNDAIRSSPAISKDGKYIYVGSDDKYLYAITSAKGTQYWRFETKYNGGGKIQSSPAIGTDGTIYVGCNNNALYAVQPNGQEKWRFDTLHDEGGPIYSSPAIGTDGTIYFGCDNGALYAVEDNGDEGKEKWRYDTGDKIVFSSPAVGEEGTIYIGSYDKYIYAINPDGSLKWKYKTGGEIHSSPSIGADGTLYFGSADGYLYAIQDKD